MPWVLIQRSTEATWDDYERVAREVGDDAPKGLIYHAAGETEGGHWQMVDIWESEEDFNRFRDERLMPAVERALGSEAVQAGPPPTESFEVKHSIKP